MHPKLAPLPENTLCTMLTPAESCACTSCCTSRTSCAMNCCKQINANNLPQEGSCTAPPHRRSSTRCLSLSSSLGGSCSSNSLTGNGNSLVTALRTWMLLASSSTRPVGILLLGSFLSRSCPVTATTYSDRRRAPILLTSGCACGSHTTCRNATQHQHGSP